MGGRSKPDEEQACCGVAKTRIGSSPIFLMLKSPCFFVRYSFAPFDQSGTLAALDDVALQFL